jgi:hypothetical protein
VGNELASSIGIVTAAAARTSASEAKVALGRVRERLENWARLPVLADGLDRERAVDELRAPRLLRERRHELSTPRVTR